MADDSTDLTDHAESVRPPQHLRPERDGRGDPLAGWDVDDHEVVAAGSPPAARAVMAGATVTGVLVGLVTGGPRARDVVIRGVQGGLVGAVVALGALRAWQRPPEDDTWAVALSPSTPPREASTSR